MTFYELLCIHNNKMLRLSNLWHIRHGILHIIAIHCPFGRQTASKVISLLSPKVMPRSSYRKWSFWWKIMPKLDIFGVRFTLYCFRDFGMDKWWHPCKNNWPELLTYALQLWFTCPQKKIMWFHLIFVNKKGPTLKSCPISQEFIMIL